MGNGERSSLNLTVSFRLDGDVEGLRGEETRQDVGCSVWSLAVVGRLLVFVRSWRRRCAGPRTRYAHYCAQH